MGRNELFNESKMTPLMKAVAEFENIDKMMVVDPLLWKWRLYKCATNTDIEKIKDSMFGFGIHRYSNMRQTDVKIIPNLRRNECDDFLNPRMYIDETWLWKRVVFCGEYNHWMMNIVWVI